MTRDDLLGRLDSRSEEWEWVASTPGTPAEIWATCPRGDWLLYLATSLGVDRRGVVLAACDCAETTTPHLKGSTRWAAHAALEVARRWARGEATEAEVHAAVDQAFDVEDTVYPVGAEAGAFRAAILAADAVVHVVCAAAASDSAAQSAAYAAAVIGGSRFTAAFASAYGAALVPARLRAADLVRARIPWATVEAALLGGAS